MQISLKKIITVKRQHPQPMFSFFFIKAVCSRTRIMVEEPELSTEENT